MEFPILQKVRRNNTMKTIIPDTNMYKIFPVGERYGILTWCNRLIFEPLCIRKPNIVALERYGHTFVLLEQGFNIIDTEGELLLKECVQEIGWVVRNKIIGYTAFDGTENLYFLETKNVIRNLTDLSFEETFYQTYRENRVGLITLSGQTIFEPIYSGVAIFDQDIFIAYTPKRNALLNSPLWEKAVRAESFKNYPVGILAKFSAGKYGWINPDTGRILKQEELTKNQRNLIEIAMKKEEC